MTDTQKLIELGFDFDSHGVFIFNDSYLFKEHIYSRNEEIGKLFRDYYSTSETINPFDFLHELNQKHKFLYLHGNKIVYKLSFYGLDCMPIQSPSFLEIELKIHHDLYNAVLRDSNTDDIYKSKSSSLWYAGARIQNDSIFRGNRYLATTVLTEVLNIFMENNIEICLKMDITHNQLVYPDMIRREFTHNSRLPNGRINPVKKLLKNMYTLDFIKRYYNNYESLPSLNDEEYKDSFSAYHKWRKHEIYLYPRMNRPDIDLLTFSLIDATKVSTNSNSLFSDFLLITNELTNENIDSYFNELINDAKIRFYKLFSIKNTIAADITNFCLFEMVLVNCDKYITDFIIDNTPVGQKEPITKLTGIEEYFNKKLRESLFKILFHMINTLYSNNEIEYANRLENYLSYDSYKNLFLFDESKEVKDIINSNGFSRSMKKIKEYEAINIMESL
ncbi:hypothetical protein Goe21_00400 [Bacillus phage vB_BsuM-Goe21]|nr:hypothetical protein Goe21_00400 [Bacillus phage vB_BsuM-Goe21]